MMNIIIQKILKKHLMTKNLSVKVKKVKEVLNQEKIL